MVEFLSRITKIVDYPVSEGAPTRVFECSVPEGVAFPYISGQFAMIAHEDVKMLQNPALLKWASYSISSSPHQKNMLEFCIGEGSPTGVSHKLMTMDVGEEFKLRGPFGKFLLDETSHEYVFLATGTGIAPLISMVRTLLAKGASVPITLYFGFRFPSQYMYKEELEQMQRDHTNFRCVIVASRPDSTWVHSKGHIQDVLKDFTSPRVEQTKVYICGKPEIAEELVKFCDAVVKFNPENVIIEKW